MSSSNSPLITFLVPSHKEGDLIRLTCETILDELKKEGIENFEIIVSDCNHEKDGGVEAGETLIRKESRVRYVRQNGCFNLGKHYAYGLREARGEYFMMVPGDNEIMGEAIGSVLRARGQAELIITYTENQEVRVPIRRLIFCLGSNFDTILA
jgi:glycosyltransferase involved in cell wall biosynthesis